MQTRGLLDGKSAGDYGGVGIGLGMKALDDSSRRSTRNTFFAAIGRTAFVTTCAAG